MTAAISLDQLSRIFAGRMLNSTFEGIAVALFAWVLLRLVGRRNSSTRFAVWFSALLTIAALPVLIGFGSNSAQAGSSSSAITVPASWAICAFAVWALIAGTALLRVAIGLLQLRKLRASCTAIDAAILDPVLRETMQGVQAVRSVTLCLSSGVRVPTAVGFLKPMVVLPSWAMQELSTTELNSILIHELAHLRRWDDWTNLAQQVLKALLFFHPAVWWIESKLALEREMACDDAVLAETANPRGYAQCLISLAEKSFMRRGVAMAQAIVNRVHQTSLRVSQILDVNRPGATRVWKPALYSVAAFSAVCLASLSRAPQLVAFEDRAPQVAVASANSAGEMLISASEFDLNQTHVVATPVVFHGKGTSSLVPQMTEKKSGLPRLGQGIRKSTNPESGLAGQENREGTSSLVPQMAENRSGILTQSAFSPTAEEPELSQANSNDAAPQTIFVVMHSEEYSQAGPMLWKLSVWHVVVFDSSNIPVESRIPAKQI